MLSKFAIASALLTAVSAQQKGTVNAETHPSLTTQKCTASGCTSQDSSIVLDANWRWVHDVSGYTNCYTGNTWDSDLCSDATTCATNCAVDGADYETTYGITTDGDALTLSFVTDTNVGSRVYLMANDSTYEMFDLENAEFTFDVDVSALPCGINGALYFTQMDSDGGLSKYSGNTAGAEYGTGYCDAQCPQDLKFINGEANVVNWTASTGDSNSGTGAYGTCCTEMDVWEANSVSAAYTPHVCSVTEQTRCENDVDCGVGAENRDAGFCDKDGCDFNSYRLGNESFYGSGKTVDTSSVFTVVTQFIGSPLTEIRRMYIQNGVLIKNSQTDVSGMTATNSITDDFCTEQKTAFGDTDYFEKLGGLSTMGTALQSGMVLAMSIWDDYDANMLWLDSDYPTNGSSTTPGVARGTCDAASGVPATVEADHANATVTYSNIKWGTLNSTYSL